MKAGKTTRRYFAVEGRSWVLGECAIPVFAATIEDALAIARTVHQMRDARPATAANEAAVLAMAARPGIRSDVLDLRKVTR